jgi:hypothetical protein
MKSAIAMPAVTTAVVAVTAMRAVSMVMVLVSSAGHELVSNGVSSP